MYFGGINGFNVFYPERIQANPYVPPVVITTCTAGSAIQAETIARMS